ncbi:MAG: hypothetical protein ACRCWR_02410 [Saezia sp.]
MIHQHPALYIFIGGVFFTRRPAAQSASLLVQIQCCRGVVVN